MNRTSNWAMIFLLSLIFISNSLADTTADKNAKKPTIKELGNNLYQVGNIKIDKNKKVFTITGTVIRNEPPVEFIAVTKGGEKAYESLLEMEVNAFEFNLACILIGLDEKKGKSSPMHFSPEAVEGDKVDITMSWKKQDKNNTLPISQLLESETGKNLSSDWVYTASTFTPDGQFLANLDGTLIGFVHSINTIIEHRTGLGLGNYGGITISNKLPPLGTKITLEIKNKKL